MTISQEKFWNLEEIKNAQQIQMRNPWGSKEHRGAFIVMLELAKKYGIEKHFDTLEDYDG